MPTYEYKCEACGASFERFQSITAEPIKKCPTCGKNKVKRLIGAGAGLIFKGSGFYITDYRSDGYRSSAKSDSASSSSSSSAASPSSASSNGASSSGNGQASQTTSKPASKPAAKSKK